MKKKLELLFFLLPVIILVAFFVYGFIGWSFYTSLTDWRIIGVKGEFVGFENYKFLFTRDRSFKSTLFNTLELSAIFIGVTMPLGLALAILLDLGIYAKKVFRIIFLLPLSFSFVASASMWFWMFSPEIGVINSFLRLLGMGNLAQPWITSSTQSLWCIAIAYVWQFSGFATLVYYSGISGVSEDIREAARIDGASKFQEYWRIVIPMQKPATLTVLVILLMYSLKVFDLVWLMTGGGPGRSSEVLSTLMYKTTFSRNFFGRGASIGIVMFVISLIIILPFFVRRRRSDYE
ncbi:MAG: glucose/mannose transport system permease protein [Thermotogaceae bacterium]|jgi:glucose/mannose transport system permease protein|nr:glucose/mannose transport system permease protein [Thermotogaceae bacterium]